MNSPPPPSPPPSPPPPPPRDENNGLLELLETLSDDSLTPEEAAQLEQRLLSDPSALEFYLRFINAHAQLLWLNRAEYESGLLAKLDEDEGLENEAQPRRPIVGRFPAIRPWIVGIMAVAAVVAVGMAMRLSWGGGTPATLTRSLQATWDPAHAATHSEPLPAGRKLVLQEGWAEITFATGAKVMLQGPAALTITNSNAARLELGQLTADVPPAATGFTIDVPTGKIIDRGTRFGVIVGPLPKAKAGQTVEVHVLKGKVEVETAAQQGAGTTVTELNVNEALRSNTASKAVQRIPAKPAEFIPSFMDPSTLTRGDILVNGPGGTICRASDSALFAARPDRKNDIHSLAFSADGTALYAATNRWSGSFGPSSKLFRMDMTDPQHPRQVGKFQWGKRLTAAPDGTLLAYDTEQMIVRFDKNHRRTALAKLPGDCMGLVVSPTGEIYVAVAKQFVARIDSAKGTLTPVVSDVDPIGLVVDPASGDLLVGVAVAGSGMEIRRYDLAGDQATLRETLKLQERMSLLAVTDDGMILATPQKGVGLWQIHPKSGQRSLVHPGAATFLAIYRPEK